MTNNGTHVTYENAVQSTVGQENAVISRKRMMKVNFSCTFDLEMTLSLADAIMPKIQHFEVNLLCCLIKKKLGFKKFGIAYFKAPD